MGAELLVRLSVAVVGALTVLVSEGLILDVSVGMTLVVSVGEGSGVPAGLVGAVEVSVGRAAGVSIELAGAITVGVAVGVFIEVEVTVLLAVGVFDSDLTSGLLLRFIRDLRGNLRRSASAALDPVFAVSSAGMCNLRLNSG